MTITTSATWMAVKLFVTKAAFFKSPPAHLVRTDKCHFFSKITNFSQKVPRGVCRPPPGLDNPGSVQTDGAFAKRLVFKTGNWTGKIKMPPPKMPQSWILNWTAKPLVRRLVFKLLIFACASHLTTTLEFVQFLA